MQALSARNRTYAFDLWGFGDSSQHSEKYSLDAYVEMLHGFLDVLAVRKPVILVGHALGAAVSLRYTVKYPQDVDRVAAVSLPVTGTYMNERLAGDDPFASFVRSAGMSWPEVDNEVRKADTGAIAKSVYELRQTDFLPDISACERPMMLVFGKQDQIVKEPGNSLPLPTPERTYISLDANHFPMLEDKVKFNRLVLDFVLAEGDLQQISPKDHWVRRNR